MNSPRESAEKLVRHWTSNEVYLIEVCDYDNSEFIEAVEKALITARNEALEEAAIEAERSWMFCRIGDVDGTDKAASIGKKLAKAIRERIK